MKKQENYISGLLKSEADVTDALKQYRAAHPGCWFGILIGEDTNYYVYGYATGRSHRAVRNRTARLHQREKFAWAGCCFVIGKCNKPRCCCGGRTYISEALRLPDMTSWCSAGGDSRPFADDDLDNMLVHVFRERRGYERLIRRTEAVS